MKNTTLYALKGSLLNVLDDTFDILTKDNSSVLVRNIGIAVKIINGINADYSANKYDAYFETLKQISTNEIINKLCQKIVKKLPYETLHKYDKNEIRRIKIDDIYIYTIVSIGSHEAVGALYYDYEDNLTSSTYVTKILSKLKDLYGNSYILSGNNYNLNVSSQAVLSNVYKDKTFEDISKYLNDFIKNNISRSIVLYGNPGTGKTTMAQLLSTELGLNSIKLPNGMLNYETLNLVEKIKPDIVIMDDIDKCDISYGSNFISCLELLKNKVKVVILTANDKDYLDKHSFLVRPGRIDKFFEINQLNKSVVLDVIGKENEDLYPIVEDFPMAFLIEIKNILKVYGRKYLENNLEELVIRASNNKKKESDILRLLHAQRMEKETAEDENNLNTQQEKQLSDKKDFEFNLILNDKYRANAFEYLESQLECFVRPIKNHTNEADENEADENETEEDVPISPSYCKEAYIQVQKQLDSDSDSE